MSKTPDVEYELSQRLQRLEEDYEKCQEWRKKHEEEVVERREQLEKIRIYVNRSLHHDQPYTQEDMVGILEAILKLAKE